MATTKKAPKKVDVKKVTKYNTVSEIQEFYEQQGFAVSNGSLFGFTDTTLVVHLENCDIQIKIVAPGAKNGERYSPLETEE